MVSRGFPWLPVASRGFLWLSVACCGFLWFPWFSVVSCECHDGFTMNALSITYGFPVDSPVNYLLSPVNPYQFPMDKWIPCELVDSCGLPVDFLWTSHGFSMVSLLPVN